MTYTVVINHQGEQACLACDTRAEEERVRQSFVNWGGMGYDITIEAE